MKILKDSGIILIISLMLFLGIEFSFRLIYPNKIIKFSKENSIAYEFNPDYLIALKPNIAENYIRIPKNGGDTVSWRTNSDGFRGESLKKSSLNRIFVYGDSNIQARFTKRENTFTEKLEKYLINKDQKDFEVVNAGVVGFGPDQSLIRLKQESDIYKPKLIVFHVFADNDFGDIIRNRLLKLTENNNLSKYSIDNDSIILKKKKPFYSNLLIYQAAFKIKLKLISLLDLNKKEIQLNTDEVFETFEEWCVRSYEKYINNMERMNEPRNRFDLYKDTYDIDIAADVNLESSKLKIKLLEQILKEASGFLETRKIELLVLIQPSVIDLTKNNFKVGYKDVSGKYYNYARTNLTSVVEDICINNNIKYINLYSSFVNNNPKDLYFTGWNNHWNDKGQDYAASIVANYIMNVSLFK